MRISCLYFLFCFTFFINPCSYALYTDVIYGVDNRVEVVDYYLPNFQIKARSVAGLVPKKHLLPSLNGVECPGCFFFSQRKTLQLIKNLCPGEAFSKQVSLPICNGFLLADDVMLTVGHCIRTDADVKNHYWVFDYVKGTKTIAKENVYEGLEIIKTTCEDECDEDATKDSTLVRLKKVVVGRDPLPIRLKGKVKVGTEVVLIGNPNGIPMKIIDNGFVLKRKWNYFIANIDSYKGNSGAPVFNKYTGLVEGMLFDGEEDYVSELSGCRKNNIIKMENKKIGEKVLKIKKVKGLKKLLKQWRKENAKI